MIDEYLTPYLCVNPDRRTNILDTISELSEIPGLTEDEKSPAKVYTLTLELTVRQTLCSQRRKLPESQMKQSKSLGLNLQNFT